MASRPIKLYYKEGRVIDADELTSISFFKPLTPRKALERLGIYERKTITSNGESVS